MPFAGVRASACGSERRAVPSARRRRSAVAQQQPKAQKRSTGGCAATTQRLRCNVPHRSTVYVCRPRSGVWILAQRRNPCKWPGPARGAEWLAAPSRVRPEASILCIDIYMLRSCWRLFMFRFRRPPSSRPHPSPTLAVVAFVALGRPHRRDACARRRRHQLSYAALDAEAPTTPSQPRKRRTLARLGRIARARVQTPTRERVALLQLPHTHSLGMESSVDIQAAKTHTRNLEPREICMYFGPVLCCRLRATQVAGKGRWLAGNRSSTPGLRKLSVSLPPPPRPALPSDTPTILPPDPSHPNPSSPPLPSATYDIAG